METTETKPLLWRRDHLPALLNMGQRYCDELIATGVIPSIKIGRRRMVSAVELAKFIAKLAKKK